MAKTMRIRAIQLVLIQTNYRKRKKNEGSLKGFILPFVYECVCMLERDKARIKNDIQAERYRM